MNGDLCIVIQLISVAIFLIRFCPVYVFIPIIQAIPIRITRCSIITTVVKRIQLIVKLPLIGKAILIRIRIGWIGIILIFLFIAKRIPITVTVRAVLALGVTEAFGTDWFGSTYGNLIGFTILVLVLIIRPKGILGKAD